MVLSNILKDARGFYKLENGYRRKLVESKCVMCSAIRYLKPSKVRTHCRKCAYIVNAFKINGYIKRPDRDKSSGKYIRNQA